MKTREIPTLTQASIDDYDTLILLDTATPNQLADWATIVQEFKAKKIFIDHHKTHPDTEKLADYTFIDESATSTCELVHRIYTGLGIDPSPEVAHALLLGIAYDSRHFSIATPDTLNAASALLEINGPIEDILSTLRTERNRPEKIARIKAAQRMQIHDTQGWTLATSRLSSFQASAARALISLGADASIVCGSKKEELSASLRSTTRFYKTTQIHLGDIAQILGKEFGGAGSGHPTAAGVNGEGEAEKLLERAVQLISEQLSS
jgi:nanoRNase/pAp phosphatase (c-di-AMP/oligoRNAs hydrolase)